MPATPLATPATATVEYRVSLAARRAHLYDVEARFPAPVDASLELQLPVWTPGSYLVREFERHLQDLVCTDGEGRPLVVRKRAKATFCVDAAGATEVRARYKVYAHELTVRTAHLDDGHAFWNGACLFLYDRARPQAAAVVTLLDVPESWSVATGLDRLDGAGPPRYRAPDYDALVDAPFEIGPHERLEFVVDDKRHAIAVHGRAPIDRDRFVGDVRRIVETQARLFGGLPYRHYTFLLHLVPGGYGGLEHRNSSTLLASPFAFQHKQRYQELLELVSHELFHLWNVKRLHPAALGPFDYQAEAHTRSLWVVEGWTSYYDRHVLRRAGLVSAERYLERLGEELTKLHLVPGRRHQSLEEASFDAWIKLYRPDENTNNSTVSYYLKGSIVALLLDLEIRRRTDGARTLDDALRALWREYGEAEPGRRGYPDEAVQRVVEAAAGVSLDDFFAAAVRGRGELDLDGPLGFVGLRARRVGPEERGTDEGGGAWLGATTVADGAGRVRVTEVAEDGPGQAGGLSPGDELIALDGWRVDEAGLRERVGQRRPGEEVRLTLFRREELRDVAVTLGRRPFERYEVAAVEDASEAQRAAYAAWLGAEWPPAAPTAPKK